jgi:hypothetical protein
MPESLMDQTIHHDVARLVNSADGIKRAVRATNDGQPAVAGVDALLRQELGSEYERANNGVWWAGFAVAQLMREMGFVEAGMGECPPGCVADRGLVWKPKVAARTLDGSPAQT